MYCQVTFPPGYNPKVSHIKMTWEKLHFTHRLLIFYVVVKMCQLAAGELMAEHPQQHEESSPTPHTPPVIPSHIIVCVVRSPLSTTRCVSVDDWVLSSLHMEWCQVLVQGTW